MKCSKVKRSTVRCACIPEAQRKATGAKNLPVRWEGGGAVVCSWNTLGSHGETLKIFRVTRKPLYTGIYCVHSEIRNLYIFTLLSCGKM